jgi:2,4-dienoyl-CoA reductase-like NADH-dependent reductase (Old Yellow Enzyme family)
MKLSDSLEILFKPTRIGGLDLHNRIAMAPMTRAMSPGGVPGENVARYYRRRAEGGVGIIITEGTFISHPSAGHDENAPRIYGDDALNGWRRVVEQVHDAGARIFAQLWHVGLVRKPQVDGVSMTVVPAATTALALPASSEGTVYLSNGSGGQQPSTKSTAR